MNLISPALRTSSADEIARKRSNPDGELGRVPTIDALRGLAAIAVLLFHGLHAFSLPGELSGPLQFLRLGTEYGWLGVSMFFALSGWCIAQRIHTAFRLGESAAEFLVDRALRIFPTYWAALTAALSLRVAADAMHPSGWDAGLPQGVWTWLGEIFLLQPYMGFSGFLMVSWTLVFELGFYLLAATALVARRGGLRCRWLIAAGAVLCGWTWSDWRPAALLVLDRWPEFFAGVIAWQAARDSRARVTAAAVFALIVLPFLLPTEFSMLATAVGCGTALVLLLTARARLRRSFRSLATLGAFSYPLYLIHMPLMSPFLNLTSRFVSKNSAFFVVVWIASLLLGIFGGWALHRAIEAPAERWRRALLKSRRHPPTAIA